MVTGRAAGIQNEVGWSGGETVALPGKLRARLDRSTRPPAVVVGTDVTGLTLARAVAGHGVVVIGVDAERRWPAGWSSAFSFVGCPDLHGPGFIGFLEGLAASLPDRPVLFLSMDEHVKLVGAHGQHLRERYRLEFPTPAAVDLLMSKERFGVRAEAEGWPVPRTAYIHAAADLEAVEAGLGFPVILKPRIKNLAFRTHSPSKSFRCADAGELRRAYALMSQWEAEAVVQEWIPGGDEEIWFSLHYLDAELNEVGGFEGRKLRQWVPECGSTSMAVGVATPRVSELSRRILTVCGCVGFGAVEYKRDPRTDEFRIMEPTVGRINLQAGVAAANGVNYIARAYFHLIGESYPVQERGRADVKWILGASDYRSARFYMQRGELSWGGYLHSLRGPKQWAVWRWNDPGLLRGWVRKLATRPLRRVARLLGRRHG